MTTDPLASTHDTAPDDAAPAHPARRWAAHVETIHDTIACRVGRAVPARVDAAARLIILDTLGCAFAGRTAPEIVALERQATILEPGMFRFPGGKGIGIRPAMQILAIGPTWHEACEGHAFAHGRPGIAVLAALLPLAIARDASLGALIEAFVTGYEVGARAGGWLRVAPGLHVDGNWPALGVAAGVGRLLGLDPAQIVRAIDIAACQLPYSLYLPIRTGRNVRNGYLAHSAALGLDSALAAQAGFDAPGDALAHYAEHHCRADIRPLPPAASDLLLQAYLKPFAAVRHVHYGAIAARRIRERLHGDTTRIRRITLAVYEEASIYCDNPRPQTLLAAQFSLTFGVAAMLRHGALDAASYQPSSFHDAELRRLETQVTVVIDPQLTRGNQRGARLQVEIDGGAPLTEEVSADDPALLLSADQTATKFIRHLAADGVSEEAAKAFFRTVQEDGGGLACRSLWALLAGSPG